MMNAMIIPIYIEEITEGNDKYFLATSPEIEGFLFEANSMDEMMEYAPKHMEILLELRRERLQREKLQNNVKKHKFLKDLIFNFSYNVKSDLQYV